MKEIHEALARATRAFIKLGQDLALTPSLSQAERPAMTIVRIVTDVIVAEQPGTGEIAEASAEMSTYLQSVVAPGSFGGGKAEPSGRSHIHVSTEDRNCETCIRLARDGKH